MHTKLEAYRVPSLAEADTIYAGLVAKRVELLDKQSSLLAERRKIEKAISADTSIEVPSKVAVLLGDEPGTKAMNRRRVSEIRAEHSDLEVAIRVVDRRLTEAKTNASRAVCDRVRSEYAKRVRAMVKALMALDEAHRHYDDLRYQLEEKDIAWTSLVPMSPRFLGASNDPNRQIARYIREAKEAGYAD